MAGSRRSGNPTRDPTTTCRFGRSTRLGLGGSCGKKAADGTRGLVDADWLATPHARMSNREVGVVVVVSWEGDDDTGKGRQDADEGDSINRV